MLCVVSSESFQVLDGSMMRIQTGARVMRLRRRLTFLSTALRFCDESYTMRRGYIELPHRLWRRCGAERLTRWAFSEVDLDKRTAYVENDCMPHITLIPRITLMWAKACNTRSMSQSELMLHVLRTCAEYR
jgi:hypothetical protein